MGLEEDKHFTAKMPEGGKASYVSILRKGLEHAAWLSEYGSGRQRELVAEFVDYILQRAEEAGGEVYEKATKIVEEGMSRGSLTLKGFAKRVEVGDKEHMVKVIDEGAKLEKSESGKLSLRIKITAEVDGVKSEYTTTFSRRSKNNEVVGRAIARADAPDGREEDAERFAAVIKALTGEEPWMYRINNVQVNDRVRQVASKGLHALRRAYRRHREVAGGDKPPVTHQ
jgi:flavin-dependent dehydrogenase